MSSRISEYIDSEVSLPAKARLPGDAKLYNTIIGGNKTFKELADVFQQQLDQSVQKELEKRKRAEFEEYVSTIFNISALVAAGAGKFTPKLKINECRARIDSKSEDINLFFLIEASYADEHMFASVITSVENSVLKVMNSVVEILYLNRKGKQIDHEAIVSDFPSTVDLEKLIDARRISAR